MPKYITFLLLLLSFSTIAQQKIDEELIIFVQKKTDSEFTAKNLQELEATMKAIDIPVKFIDIEKKGAPKEIGYTPFLVYRNHIGNKYFKGRYTSHKRILNFIRTVRRLPQEDINYEETDVFVWKHDRSNLAFKLKVTDPSGAVDATFDNSQFKEDYLNGLKEGFENARFQSKQKIGTSDDLFYCNFYPYIAEDGKVYISTEIYSHYDCHDPIYKAFDTPAVGSSIQEGFKVAGQQIFDEIKRQVLESELGDAMNFIQKTIKTVSWKKLKLRNLDPPAQKMQTNLKDVNFPKEWVMTGPVDASTPLLAFNFPPPLRQYGGEIKKASGTLNLSEAHSLKEAIGNFEVEVSSLEMGVSSLNNAVRQTMLFVDKFPTAKLVFKDVKSEDFELKLGKVTRAIIKADLTIVNKTAPVYATTEFEPFLSDDGTLLLYITTRFVAEDLTGSFAIDGPDGPAEANNKMYFSSNFIMKAMETN